MSGRASRYVIWSQLSLGGFSVMCVALHPGFVLKWNEGGFSNYGIHIKTSIPYTLAFGLCAYFAIGAARRLRSPKPDLGNLRILLGIYGVLMVLTLVSSYGYSLNVPLKDFHTAVGIVTMLFEPAASVWMYLRLRGSVWDGVLLATELSGFAIAVIDFAKVAHVLFLAQVLTAAAFGFLLVHAVARMERSSSPTSNSAAA